MVVVCGTWRIASGSNTVARQHPVAFFLESLEYSQVLLNFV